MIGIDNMNDYYDVRLKESRLVELSVHPSFVFIKGSIADKSLIEDAFKQYQPQIIVNLAAQAGVCYSIINPDAYIESNLIGFYNILEACRSAAILMMKAILLWNIWCMRPAHLSMALTRRFRIARMIRWITRFPFMRLRRNQTN